MKTSFDKIILSPEEIDLKISPIRRTLIEETYILGAFNPGLIRLQNGNLLIMVRIAEALSDPIANDHYKIIRWTKNNGYSIDLFPLNELEMSDPRKFTFKHSFNKTYCLTSSSWLLPLELSENGDRIVNMHTDKCIAPTEDYQEYGIEDARITFIDNEYYMTVCSVSSFRHSTVLYSSSNGIEYKLHGIILDHQNKDMVLFPRKINSKYYALTRPVGDHYFDSVKDSEISPGPSIFLSESPDLLHWKPVEGFAIRPLKNTMLNMKVGGGAPPIETEYGWLVIFHGVEGDGDVGIYRSFICLLDKENPSEILKICHDKPILESIPEMTKNYEKKKYLNNVVFTTGIQEDKKKYVLASGELDLCCRISHIDKNEIIKLLNE